MKKLPLILFLSSLLYLNAAWAQTDTRSPSVIYSPLADSLQQVLYGSEGIERVEVLTLLSWELKTINPSRSYRLAEEALQISNALQYDKGMAGATKNMGIARAMQGRFAEALTLIFEEIEMRKALGDTAAIASSNNNIGYILREQENYDLALEYFYRSLRLTRSTVDNPNLQAITLNNIGQIHRENGQYQAALKVHMESLEVLEQVDNSMFARATNLNNLGELFLLQAQHAEAKMYFQQARTLEQQLGNPIREAEALDHLAAVALAEGQLDSAEMFLQEGFSLAEKLDNRIPLRDLHHTAATLAVAKGAFEKAYRHEVRYSFLNDSLRDRSENERILALEGRFAAAQKQNEIDILQKQQALNNSELRKARIMNQGIWVVAILLLVVAVLSFTNNRLRKRANNILLIQKNEVRKQRDELERSNLHLQKVNHEMDNFMYRVSHDLRSPIASVMGLIKLAGQESNPAKRSDFLGLMQRSMNKLDNFIQDIMDLTRNSRQDIRYKEIDLQQLVEDYFEQYKFHDGRTNIVCEYVQKGDGNLISDEYRLGIILSNLISNAVRYSAEYRPDAVVKISVQWDVERVSIQVRDNGPGISEEHQKQIYNMFFRASNTTNGSGLGLYIVKETTEKLGGSIRVASEMRHGATFTVELPNQKLGNEKQSPISDFNQVLNA